MACQAALYWHCPSHSLRKVVDSCYQKVCWTPEQVALLPRRLRDYGNWPKAFPVDARWIKDGFIDGDKDFFPWLHEYQQGGYDVCVLGASLDACKVCVEAYESGFQPVFIFLEDKVLDENKEFTLSVVELLHARRFRTGVLNCGFEVVTTTSKEVKLKLESDGEVRDVRLEAKAQRFDVSGKPVDYVFKGPSLVIGNVVDAKMAEGGLEVGSLLAFHERVTAETKRVTCPDFWERRNDPECRKFATPTFDSVLPIMCCITLQWSICYAVFRFFDREDFVLLRAVAEPVHRGILETGVIMIDFIYYGLDLPLFRVPAFVLVTATIYQIGTMLMCFLKWEERLYIGDFALSCMGVSCIQCLLQAIVHFFSNVKLRPWQLFWASSGLLGTAGSWFQCMPIMLLYQLLLRWNGIVASVYLSVVLAMFEVGLVKFVGLTYTVVAKQRQQDPLQLRGDQKLGISFCVCCTNCFVETARLASLVCGAVGAEDVWFLLNVVVFLATSAVISSAFRTGFMANQLVKIPRIGHLFCPSSLWLLHNNTKFCMGWCRYFNMLGLFLCRGFMHGRWRMEHWLVQEGDEGVWCWSGVVLTTVFLAFCAEVLEDATVYRLCLNRVPLINGPVYKEMMLQRLANPTTASRTHIAHYMTPPPAASRVSKGRSLHADDLVLSPNLDAVRPLPLLLVYAIGSANGILLLGIISVGLGAGNTFGFCRSLSLQNDHFTVFLKNFIVWSFDCADL